MSKWKLQDGVVLEEIQGVYFLAADREARKSCPYICQINELGAFIWTHCSQGKSKEEIVKQIHKEFDVPAYYNPESDLDIFLKSLEKNHYIVCEADGHEI